MPVIHRSLSPLVVALWLCALAPRAAAQDAAAGSDATLEQIASRVESRFYSTEVLAQRDWPALLRQARAEIGTATGTAARATVLQALLAGLHTSHTDYFAPDDPRHADLAAVYQRVLDGSEQSCADKSLLPPRPIESEQIGVWWLRDGTRWFVGGLLDGDVAQKAGLLVGDEIVSADGAAFQPVAAFAGKSGSAVKLRYRRERDGELRDATVTPSRVQPMANYVAALRASVRIVEHKGVRVGYMRMWSGVGEHVVGEVREALRNLNAQQMQALVFDIRDGWGGVPPELVTMFDRRVPVLVSRSRGGETYPFDTQARVPTVVLINEGVRSGKEVFAHAVRKHALATLVGTGTPGALLPGTAFCLPDRGLLYLAVGTTTIDGELLEGHGVAPHVAVPFDRRYAGGKDPQLEAALDALRCEVTPDAAGACAAKKS